MIRVRITKSKVSDDLSVRVQLEYAVLRNKNRGRDIDKRTFDARIMGRENSLLDTPKDVNLDYSTKNHIKIDNSMSDHKVTGVRPENNTKADIIPRRYFLQILKEIQESVTYLNDPKYDDGCQTLLVRLEFLLSICDRYPNTVAGSIYKLKRKKLRETWDAWWERNEKKIPAKYRAGIKESADELFARLMAVRSNVLD